MRWTLIGGVVVACLNAAGCTATQRRGVEPAELADVAHPEDPNMQAPFLFREAKLPQDFPPPGPTGVVVIRTYPPYRLARVHAAGTGRAGSPNGMFRPLFNHIQRHDIAMTAPVEIEYSAAPPVTDDSGAPGTLQRHATAMAFLYAEPSLGQPGPDPADPRVAVEDVPALTVLSVGVRGGYTARNLAAGVKQLEAWLAANPGRLRVVGPPRYLAYNSPFVPGFLKFGEVQLPVEPPE